MRTNPKARRRTYRQGLAGEEVAFVGRDDTMATVVDAMAQPCVVFIEGEAGIGKTRLVREALAATTGRRVLVAACAPWRDPVPLGPVVVGLRRLWQRVGAVELSPLGGALRPLFPEWVEQLPAAPEPLEEPKETRHRLLCALTELVERLEVDVLVVEDAHWADSATVEWLLMLATDWTVDSPSIVVTYRPTDILEGSFLRHLTARSLAGVHAVRIELSPLDIAATRQMVGSMLRTDEVSTQFATFLHDHCDGIPLAVEETVRLLRDRHDIVRQHGAWTRRVLEDLEVPPSVRDSVLERVSRLDPDAQRVLQAAAVLGDPADEELLAAVASIDVPTGSDGVTIALVSGLLREAAPGSYGFRHVLDAQAVEDAIPASERRRFNYRAASALQDRDHPSVARLARHFRAAGDTDAWIRYAESAADLALKAGDDHTAVVTLLEVLDMAEHPTGRRVRLVRKLAEAAFFGAVEDDDLADRVAIALRDALSSEGVPQCSRGELRLNLGRMLWRLGQPLASYEEMEAAIPDLGERPDLAIRAMTNLAMPLVPEWPASRHLAWLERATELADASGSPSDRYVLATTRATPLLLLGEPAAWSAVDDIPRSSPDLTTQRRLASSLLNVVYAMLAWGRYDDARRELATANSHIQSTNQHRLLLNAQLAQAGIDWYTGHWRGITRIVDEVGATEGGGAPSTSAARQFLGLRELAAGARARAERHLRRVASEDARSGLVQPEALAVPAALARLHLADGCVEKALHETRPAMEVIAHKGVWLWATDIGPVRMDALIAAGELGEAAKVVSEFAAGLSGRETPAPAAALATCRAILTEANGGRRQAAALYADAATAWAALPRPYDELLTREREGRCLLTMGEHEQALATLTDAQQRLHHLGARWDSDRIAQVLREHGVDAPQAHRRGPRGYGNELSPRELEVVELVARGMTNKQIGEKLFLSPKTVDRHLRSARRKLGATTRVGAAMAAAEAGLLRSRVDNTPR